MDNSKKLVLVVVPIVLSLIGIIPTILDGTDTGVTNTGSSVSVDSSTTGDIQIGDTIIINDDQQIQLEIMVEQADNLSFDERYMDAVSTYDEVLQIDSSNQNANIGKADALTWLWQLEQANMIVDKVLERDDVNPYANTVKGYLHTVCGEYQMAIPHFDRALKSNVPNQEKVDAYVGLGDAYVGLGRYSDATNQYNYALEIKPREIHAKIALGDILVEKEKYGEARTHFEKILLDEPESVFAKIGLGSTYVGLNMYEESEDLFNSVLTASPGNHFGLTGLADAKSGLGQFDEALELYNQVLDECPYDRYANEGKEKLSDI